MRRNCAERKKLQKKKEFFKTFFFYFLFLAFFSDDVVWYEEDMQLATAENVASAVQYVTNMAYGGGTNFSDALIGAIDLLKLVIKKTKIKT